MKNKAFLFVAYLFVSVAFYTDVFAQYDFESSDYSSDFDYPSDAEGLLKLVDENMAKNERVDALKAVDKLIDLEPDNTDYLMKRVEIKRALRNYDSALEDLDLLLSKTESIDAMKIKADILMIKGDDEAAFNIWNDLVNKIGGVEGLFARVEFFKKNKRYEEAQKDLEKAKLIAEEEYKKLPSVAEQDSYKEAVLDKIEADLSEITSLKISGI